MSHETKHLEIMVKNCFHETRKMVYQGNQYRVTLGSGLAGLQWSPPTKSKLGKRERGNSTSQKVWMSHMCAFPSSQLMLGVSLYSKPCKIHNGETSLSGI